MLGAGLREISMLLMLPGTANCMSQFVPSAPCKFQTLGGEDRRGRRLDAFSILFASVYI